MSAMAVAVLWHSLAVDDGGRRWLSTENNAQMIESMLNAAIAPDSTMPRLFSLGVNVASFEASRRHYVAVHTESRGVRAHPMVAHAEIGAGWEWNRNYILHATNHTPP